MTAVNLVLALVGVLGVSASGPLMASIAAPALVITFWRNGLATLVIAPFAVSRRGELRTAGQRTLLLTVAAGVLLAAHFAAWVSALKLTSVASATALVSLQAGFVVLIDRLRGRSVRRAVVMGLLVSFAGVLVVSGVDLSLSSRSLIGDLLALAGGAFAAAYTVLGGHVRQSLSNTAYTVLCYGTSALVAVVVCLVAGLPLIGYDGRTWGGLVAVTVSAQLLGHSVFNHLLAVVSPTVVSLVLLLEVPGAAALAAVFLGQAPPIGVYAGLLLVLSGLAVVVLRGQRPSVEAPLD